MGSWFTSIVGGGQGAGASSVAESAATTEATKNTLQKAATESTKERGFNLAELLKPDQSTLGSFGVKGDLGDIPINFGPQYGGQGGPPQFGPPGGSQGNVDMDALMRLILSM